jgi:hypothetical protein
MLREKLFPPIIVSVSLLVFAGSVGAAEYRIVPKATLSEEYNDNVFLTASHATTDFITRAQPSLGVEAEAKGFSWNMTTGLDYRHFAKGSESDHLDPAGAVAGKLSLWEDFAHLDVADTYSRVTLDVARNTVTESVVVNQTEQNLATVSPYLNWHLGERTTLKTGYRYSDIRYWQGGGIDKREHEGIAELNRQMGERLTGTVAYDFVYIISEPPNYYRHAATAGMRYEFAGGGYLLGKFGNSWEHFTDGTSLSNLLWDGVFAKNFGSFGVLLETGVVYTEEPLTTSTKKTTYGGTFTQTFERGKVALSSAYSEYITPPEQASAPQNIYKVEVGLVGQYELFHNLMLNASFTGDHTNQEKVFPTLGNRLNQSTDQALNYPYHLYGTVGLDYTLNQHLVLGLSYGHVSYRNDINSSKGSVEGNRAIVEVRLTR